VSVVLVDDHTSVRVGLRSMLASAPALRVVDEAVDGNQALEVVRKRQPDVVVLDLLLPHRNGLEVMKSLLEEFPQMRFVAYSQREEPWFVREALDAGASAYVSKRSEPAALMLALQQTLKGKRYVDPALGELVDRAQAEPETSRARLSRREAQVLRAIARGATAKDIANRLGLSSRTMETYKARAMQKLQLRTRADLIRFAEHSGWLVDEDPLN
jgi:DNA-binding NarL/FixJ family response regulator